MKFLSIFLMLFILLASISCVMAYDYNLKNLPCALNDYYNNFDNTFNHLNTSSMNLHSYIINHHNLSHVIDDSTSIKKLENTTNNLTNESNISLINKSIDLKLGNSVINSTNIHFNTSNSFNLTVDKYNKSLGNNLSVDNVDKAYNNSNCKYNKSNDLINKDVNISKNIKSDNKTPVNNFNITSDNSITNDFDISLVNNKNNKLLYDDLTNKDVNISKNIKLDNITVVNKINNHELSKFNNTTDINESSVINVYPDTSNLTNNSSVKYNKSNVLFNDSSLNQSQFNKSFKVFELDKDSSVNDNSIGLTNDSISKELNSSEINNISNNNFSRDNHINHVSEPKQDKDYIMLLIPTVLVLLGAIILYKKNK